MNSTAEDSGKKTGKQEFLFSTRLQAGKEGRECVQIALTGGVAGLFI